MPAYRELIEGYRRFRTGAWRVEGEAYRRLGDGQDPDMMVIGCADSRVDPAKIFDTAPGQAFVVRNVANLVPPYEPGGGRHGVSAALEFAVKALSVRYIVVLGHGRCGGIRACAEAGTGTAAGEFIAPWVEIAAPARERVRARHPGIGIDALADELEFEAINQSIDNLLSFPFVREAVEADRLILKGAWFAIASGDLMVRNPQTGRFAPVDVWPGGLRPGNA